MVKQIACVYAPMTGEGTDSNPYRINYTPQSGEHIAWNLVDLLSTIRQYEEDLPSSDTVEKHSVYQAPSNQFSSLGVCIVYVYAEDTRIDLAESSPNYHVAWVYTIDRESPIRLDDTLPTQNTELTELQDFRDWLANHFGVTGTKVVNWFSNRFDREPSQIVNYLTNQPRFVFVKVMGDTLTNYEQVHSQLENS